MPGNQHYRPQRRQAQAQREPRYYPYDPNPDDPDQPSMIASHVNNLSDHEYYPFKTWWESSRILDEEDFPLRIDQVIRLELRADAQGRPYHFCAGTTDHAENSLPRISGPNCRCRYGCQTSLFQPYRNERDQSYAQAGPAPPRAQPRAQPRAHVARDLEQDVEEIGEKFSEPRRRDRR